MTARSYSRRTFTALDKMYRMTMMMNSVGTTANGRIFILTSPW
jgi:hypothetical protein